MSQPEKRPKLKKGRCYLTQEEKDVLRQMLPIWSNMTDKKSRQAYILTTVASKIQDMNAQQFGPEIISRDKEAKTLWEKRLQSIGSWFRNNKPFKDKVIFKLEKKLSLRRVVAREKADEIHALVLEDDPDIQKGSKPYLGKFQKVLSQYMELMSAECKAEMEEQRAKWEKEGPPPELQIKAARKYSRKAISDVHQALFKQMSVSCITYDFHPTEDGRLSVICHDYISAISLKNGGPTFLSFTAHNETASHQFRTAMLDYGKYVRQQIEEYTPLSDETRKQTTQKILLSEGPGGLPLIPPECLGVKGQETAEHSGQIIRHYISRHYCLASGRKDAHPPWNKIGQNPSEFFEEDCLPVGFVFQDPSRMGKSVKHFIEHLRIRQHTHGVNAFTFKFIQDGNVMHPASYPAAAAEAIAASISVLDWPVAHEIGPADVGAQIVDASHDNSEQGTGSISQPASSQTAVVSSFIDKPSEQEIQAFHDFSPERSECGLYLDNHTEYPSHGQYVPSQPVYCEAADYPIDSHFPPDFAVASSSKIPPQFNFPMDSNLPLATHDGVFRLHSPFDTQPWSSPANDRDACFTTYSTNRLPFQNPYPFCSLAPEKLPVSRPHPPIPVDQKTNISETLDLLNSKSTTSPTSTGLVLINVLKPGGTPSPLRSVKKRKRADSDAITPTLRRSTRSQPPTKQQSPKKELYPTRKPSPKKKPR